MGDYSRTRGSIAKDFFGTLERLTGWVYTADQIQFINEEFGEKTTIELDKLAKAVARKCSFKATPADMVKAANDAPQLTHTISGESKLIKRWREEDEEKSRKVDEYVNWFMKSNPLWHTARQEGWETYLHNFVRHTADTMMQMIQVRKGYGFISNAVPKDYVQVYKMLLKDCRTKITQTGMINVELALPDLAITTWKEQASRRKEIDDLGFMGYTDQLLQRYGL